MRSVSAGISPTRLRQIHELAGDQFAAGRDRVSGQASPRCGPARREVDF